MNENHQKIKVETDAHKTGLVKWFSKEKGYGFIYSEGERDYYFNVKNIKGANLPSEGDAVKFVPVKGKKGLFAKEVVLISKSTRHAKKDERNGRVKCPSCGQKIVPRLTLRYGRPNRSYCPVCGGLIRKFFNLEVWINRIVSFTVFSLVFFFMLSTCSK